MTLYTFYNDGEKLVFGTFAEGETQFFYSGFASKEDAKAATKGLHLALKRKNKPNAPFGILECEVDMVLSGIWSKIE
jgi:hypothetical protein